MNVAMILAGGTGQRFGAGIPKQFVEVLGKPILAYTLKVFNDNSNIDKILIACHPEWIDVAKKICVDNGINKGEWFCPGGKDFQGSVLNGVNFLKGKISDDDIVVISFGVAPLTFHTDINDAIRICGLHGNGISSKDSSLCTCIKDDEFCSTQSIERSMLKGFANPWAFKFGELFAAYKEAQEKNLLAKIEPHTTSLYLALGKKIWFSKADSPQAKITYKSDIDLFEGYLLLQEKRRQNHD